MQGFEERLARPWALTGFGCALALLILSRKPDVLLHAELWGDDGWKWYPDAYTDGIRCLAWPVNGYLNTLQRLGGLAAQPFPLTWAPTLFALVGLLVQIAPGVFLVSARMDQAWPDRRARAIFAVIFAVLPNAIEFYVNLTNAQWTLAILAFLVLAGTPPATRAARIFDTAVLLLSGLSGPFCLLLLPVAAWQAAAAPGDRTARMRLALLGGTALLQVGCLAGTAHVRSTAPLGAGPRTLARIVAFNILLGAELGYRGIAALPQRWPGNIWPVLITVGGAAATAAALLRGSRLLKQWTLFAALTFAAALARPQVTAVDPQWPAMAIPPMGNRYYTFAMLAWVGVLFTLAAGRGRAGRAAGAAGLAVLVLWGIPRDWNEPRFASTHFVERARAFAAAPAGTRMEFPVVPSSLTLKMVLTKPGRR